MPIINVNGRGAHGLSSDPSIEVTFPNEEPDQDPRTLTFTFTHEGVIVDGFVGDQEVDTFGCTYEEFYEQFILGGSDRPQGVSA